MSIGLNMTIRECRVPEDIEPLTGLLHRAYAELAARGLRYLATHPTPDITEKRVRAGHCFVAEVDGALVGTITVCGPDDSSKVWAYRERGTFIVGQFGVDPMMRGKGIGRSLHEYVVQFAIARGGRFMALDTAAPAEHLPRARTGRRTRAPSRTPGPGRRAPPRP
jgi:GNAT superfamily N-acetyltransferase